MAATFYSVCTEGSTPAYLLAMMERTQIPTEYRGWWRIFEGSHWTSKELEGRDPALISITVHGDRLRIFVLIAYINCKPTKAGVSFTWDGAWEWDSMSGSGRVTLGKDGRLKGRIKIPGGDECTFVAERSVEPAEPIPPPPDYRDKWRRRW